MASKQDMRTLLEKSAIMQLPRSLMDDVCSDKDFCVRIGIGGQRILRVHGDGPSFGLDSWGTAIGAVLGGVDERRVKDIQGRRWRVRRMRGAGGEPQIVMVRGSRKLDVGGEFLAMSASGDTRRRMVERLGAAMKWVAVGSSSWRQVLEERPLTVDEVLALSADLADTPTRRCGAIAAAARQGRADVATLVPKSRRYFERLVGAWKESGDIRDYLAGEGGAHLLALGSWDIGERLLGSFYLGSHALAMNSIDIGGEDSEGLLETLSRVLEHGDCLARIGAIEVGLRNLDRVPDVAPCLVELVEGLRTDDVQQADSFISAFWTLFQFVDGQLSRRRLFVSVPVYYRRLVALGQAAVIQRGMPGLSASEDFRAWALSQSLWWCRVQSWVDKRTHPEWDWRYGAPMQVKAWLVGRVQNATRAREGMVARYPDVGRAVGELSGSVHTNGIAERFQIAVPSLIETGEHAVGAMPAGIRAEVEGWFGQEELEARGLLSLVVYGKIYRVEKRTVDRAVKALVCANGQIAGIGDAEEMAVLVGGLAHVAAMCRSEDLAREVGKLVDVYGGEGEVRLGPVEAVEALVIAGASCGGLTEWTREVGEGLVRIAFGELTREEAAEVQMLMRGLGELRPELWMYCGRADAALAACARKA